MAMQLEVARRLDLSVIILTRDEEQNLPATLASLSGTGVQVFVVDSGSTDRTVAIARAAGCSVVVHPFTTQAEQLNWALSHIEFSTEWLMRLDADERPTPELIEELRRTLPRVDGGVAGLEVKRRVYFLGRWIRHGGYYPTWLLRIWRRGAARAEKIQMDEHMVLGDGRAIRLEHDIIDDNRKGLSFWIAKHNGYAEREARALVRIAAQRVSLNGQAGRRRWLKKNVYARSPLFARAFAYWSFRYIFLLGFLDGTPGLVFHFLQGFWYRFLVDAKILEERLRSKVAR